MGKSLIIKGADFSEIAIPKEYVVLDWISNSNGNTKFDMGFKPDLSKRFEFDFKLTSDFIGSGPSVSSSQKVALFGCTNSYNSNSGLIMAIRKHTTSAVNNTISTIESSNYFGEDNLNYSANGKISDTNKHTLSVCPDSILLDGIQAMSIQPTGGTLETAINNNVCLCGVGGLTSSHLLPINTSSPIGYVLTDKVRACAFRVFANKTDSTPSMNFIPVKKTEDGKPYFYDTVNAVYVLASNDGAGVIYALNGIIYNYDGSEYSE